MAYAGHLSDYGLMLEGAIRPDFAQVIARSRDVAGKMNRGVAFLMKKNGVDVHFGHGTLLGSEAISVEPSVDMDGKAVGTTQTLSAEHIIIATGARAREIPTLPVDDKDIIDYRGALLQTSAPKRLVIVGAGAIGVEFAYFYHHMGTEVTIIELLDRLVPVEDIEVSKAAGAVLQEDGNQGPDRLHGRRRKRR